MESINDELWAQIRKDFGNHFVRFKEYEKAKINYKESLSKHPEKLESANRLAKVQAFEGKPDDALRSLNKKSLPETAKSNFVRNLQECDCYYEKNGFETNMLLLNDKKLIYQEIIPEVPFCGPITFQKINDAKYKGPKFSLLNSRFDMVCTNYEDILGKNAGNCLYDQRQYFDKILHKWKPPKTNKKPTPIVLMENDPCKFSRNKVEVVIPKTVKEKYRFERIQTFFAQSYLYAGWKDFVFMNDLKKFKDLQASTQNATSFENINNSIDKCIEKNQNIIDQLHARCPLYTKRNKVRSKEKDRINKFRMHHKILREIFNAFKEIQICFKEGKLEKLIEFAEEELGFRYRVHPSYLIPHKNEYIIDICDYIALAHINDILKSTKLLNSHHDDEFELLKKILRIYWKEKKIPAAYIFGDQSTYRDPTEPDTSFLEFRSKITHLEDRISQRPMLKTERCHLLHEMGRANLKQRRSEEAKDLGQKIIDEAQGVSYLWIFLGHIMLCRAEILHKQFEEAIASMEEAISIANILKSNELKLILEYAIEIATNLTQTTTKEQ